MAKNTIKTEGKTLEQIMQELETVVTAHNTTEDSKARAEAKVKAEKLKNDYNEVAKHNAYADCLAAENPMLTFIKMYQYEVIKVGTESKTDLLTIQLKDSKGEAFKEVLNLWDFDAYCKSLNKQVTAALNWETKSGEAKDILIANLRKYIDEGGEKDVKSLKEAIQAMFDAIIMIPGKNGNNAVIMTSKQVREIYVTSGKQNFKKLSTAFARKETWQRQILAYLHCAIEGKDFGRTYGDPEATAVTEDAKTDTEETTAE